MDAKESGTKTIVVIEDDLDLRNFLSFFLKSYDFEVLTAATGEEGLHLARLVRPHAITLDLCLPGVCGLDVLKTLKMDTALRDIPVVVISATTEQMTPRDIQWSFAVISKPFNLDQLERVINAAVKEDHRAHLALLKYF